MIEFHRLILGDHVRNDAFERALRSVVRSGMTTVADIGSGTGFLAFLASKMGAKQCFLYELSDLLKLSKKIAAANGIKNCVFVQSHSAQVRKPTLVDLVVSETLGNYALEENILETLMDAKRFLKKGGTMIPQSLTQFIVPVTDSRLYRELDVWPDIGHGIDFAAAREVCMHNVYVRTIQPSDMPKGSAKVWDTIDFLRDEQSVRYGQETWSFAGEATVYGFALWWECTLVPGVTLSTAPDAPRTHWEQIFLPLLHPIEVKAGEKIDCRLTSDTRPEVKIRLQWEAASGKKVVKMDMRKGHID